MNSGQWHKAEILHSIGCRMVCQLNGHILQTNTPKNTHLRKLFWLMYTIDKDLSLLSGHPPQLTRQYCDINTDTGCDTLLLGMSTMDMRLSLFKGEVCDMLWSSRSRSCTESQTLLNIRHADDQLEEWRASQPEDLRPRLSISAGHPLPWARMDPGRRNTLVHLQLVYHLILSTIHATVRRTGAATADESLPDDLHNVVHSSVDITLEAGRSTLCFLREVIAVLKEDAFQ